MTEMMTKRNSGIHRYVGGRGTPTEDHVVVMSSNA